MAPYTPLPSGGPTGSGSNSSPRRRMSFSFHTRRQSTLPDPDEMDRAFDGPGDDDDHHDADESNALLGNQPPPSASASRSTPPMPGDYDFNRDYFLPPPTDSPPPFQPYSAANPAPGNSNGILPTEPVARPQPQPARHFLGGVLPSAFLPRRQPAQALGGGQSAVFANLSARPENQNNEDLQEWAEEEGKDAPPSYQTALRDAVPPYWDTTVVLPSSSSPFGPLSSSIRGDEILIDGMPSGNLFGFLWNMIVSAAFQWVGFLLTYVLHTTHAAMHGSRAGLGITLIKFGLSLRQAGTELQSSNHYPGDMEVDPDTGRYLGDITFEQAFADQPNPFPYSLPHPYEPEKGMIVLHNLKEATAFVHSYNHTLVDLMRPQATDVGRAWVWFSFMLMVMGWFILLASIGGYWRVKRFEYKLKQAQRESEAAQAAARGEFDPDALDNDEDDEPAQPGPTQLSYYTSAFTQALNGAREIQRGFFGHRGRPVTSRGDTLFASDEAEDELLEAQGYGLEPMARTDSIDGASPQRSRGLWGIR